MSEKLGCKLKEKEHWIEMFPYGMALGIEEDRPIIIFKDNEEKLVLSVALTPIEAGIAVSQSSTSIRKTGNPNTVTNKMLSILGVELKACYFTKIQGARQYVKLVYEGSDKLTDLELPAEDAMSFCLSTNCKYFTSMDNIKESKELQVEFQANKKAKSPLLRNRHPYLN